MFSKKVQHSLVLALVFFVLSSPMTYRLVDKVVMSTVGAVFPQLSSVLKIAEGGCPTQYGLLVHSAVFALVSYYVLPGL